MSKVINMDFASLYSNVQSVTEDTNKELERFLKIMNRRKKLNKIKNKINENII